MHRWSLEDQPLQNRVLLSANVHQQFDQYIVSVRCEFTLYKTTVFGDDDFAGDGRILDILCLD